jgi:hypothetical protein
VGGKMGLAPWIVLVVRLLEVGSELGECCTC